MKKNYMLIALVFGLSLSVKVMAQVPSYVPTNGLVGWWPFNGNANDESINTHDGSVVGNSATLTTDRFGIPNKAFNFSGGYGFIQIPDASDLSFPNEVFTFSFWLKLDPFNNATNYLGVLSKGIGSVNKEYIVYCSDYNSTSPTKHLWFRPSTPSNQFCEAIQSSEAQTTLSVWHHYVYVANGTSGSKVYVDGQLIQTQPDLTCSMGNGTGYLYFGKCPVYNSNNTPGNQNIDYNLQGVLDDVAFWNRPLDLCEIQALYGAGNAIQSIDAGSDISICAGSSVTLNGTGGSNYAWNNGVVDGLPFTPTSSGVFTLTGTNTNGCQEIDSINILINENPIVYAGQDVIVCEGNQVTLFASGATNYTWDNNVIDGESFIATFSGVYSVIGTDVNGCSSTDDLNLSVLSTPTVYAGENQNICSGSEITLYFETTDSCIWNNGVINGMPFTPTSSENYTLTIIDTNGCQNSDDVFITVGTPSSITLTVEAIDSYTLNGQEYTLSGTYTQVLPSVIGGCDSTIFLNLTINYTSVIDLENDFKISPNPIVNNIFIINVNNYLIGSTYKIIDFSGRTVFNGKINSMSQTIDIQEISKGSYFLQIDKSTAKAIKIIKQ